MDTIGLLALFAAVLLLVDLLFAGGAVTVTCAGAAMSVMAHPLSWLVLLLLAVILFTGFGAVLWR